jgi:hypothetical protein
VARPAFTRRTICELVNRIDARRWHGEGRLAASQNFQECWVYGNGELSGAISVRTEINAVVLIYRARSWDSPEWTPIKQRVLITWTACHLGGQRPWFICSSRHCGRRVAILYGAGELFACRRCHGLAYASQREGRRIRSISRSRNIRVRLGGSPDVLKPFPEKPRRMHWRTYHRLRARGEAADAAVLLPQFPGALRIRAARLRAKQKSGRRARLM